VSVSLGQLTGNINRNTFDTFWFLACYRSVAACYLLTYSPCEPVYCCLYESLTSVFCLSHSWWTSRQTIIDNHLNYLKRFCPH